MDRLKLGGFGCALGFAAGVIGLASALGGGAAAGIFSYLLGIVAAGLVAVAAFALKERFGLRLFQFGGVLIVAGNLATLVATLASLGAIQAAMAARDAAALSSALVGVLVATLAAILGWMFIGASLVMKRRAVAEALGTEQGVIVLVAGILLILSPLLGLIGLIPLAFIFFRLARGAPGAPAAAPS